MNAKGILCVGLVVVDIITEVNQYPKEDSDNRCQKLWKQTGGNASNNCTVLGILGVTPYFCGVIAGQEQKFIEESFKKHGVDISGAVIEKSSECPTSCVITSIETGSRTIIHYNKNLREVNLADFCTIDLHQFAWIHFEGRNVAEVKRMIDVVRKHNKGPGNQPITISVEVEKPLSELKSLIPLADVVFLSKDYCQFLGWNSLNEALERLPHIISDQAIAICGWDTAGAGAIQNPYKTPLLSPAFSPSQVVDTLGAGDTFIASTILALLKGESVKSSILFGCKVAGFKVGLRGWAEFQDRVHELDYVKEK